MKTPAALPFSLNRIFFLFVGLVAAMCSQPQSTSLAQGSSFSDDQTEEVKGLVREYILENPEIIAEAITLLQAKQETQKAERQQATLLELQPKLQNPPEQTVIGNPDGKVTVVEFFDYNCGYCKSMFETVQKSLRQNDDIRLVLIEFPILGPNSITATKAALAAREQDLYGPFHQAMILHRGNLNESTIMTLARGVGLNIDELKADMKDPDLDKIIARNRDMAQQLEINGTPAFLIGSTLVPGAVSLEQFNQLVEDAG